MNNSPKVRAVIFDWAGTTVDFGCCAPVAAFVEAFKRHGVALSHADVRQFMGRAKRDHIASMLKLPHADEAWKTRAGHSATEQDIDLIYATFMESLDETLASYTEVLAGVVETMASLRARGCRIGSNTGYTAKMMEAVVPRAAAQGYVADLVLTADDGARPSPTMIQMMARRFEINDFSTIIKVDDTPVGIEEGRNAGTWAIGIARTGNEVGLTESELNALPQARQDELIQIATQRLFEAGAHAVINSMAELLPVVDRIDARLAAGTGLGKL